MLFPKKNQSDQILPFCLILFHFVSFYSILFDFVRFYSILFDFVRFCSILFDFVLFCSIFFNPLNISHFLQRNSLSVGKFAEFPMFYHHAHFVQKVAVKIDKRSGRYQRHTIAFSDPILLFSSIFPRFQHSIPQFSWHLFNHTFFGNIPLQFVVTISPQYYFHFGFCFILHSSIPFHFFCQLPFSPLFFFCWVFSLIQKFNKSKFNCIFQYSQFFQFTSFLCFISNSVRAFNMDIFINFLQNFLHLSNLSSSRFPSILIISSIALISSSRLLVLT